MIFSSSPTAKLPKSARGPDHLASWPSSKKSVALVEAGAGYPTFSKSGVLLSCMLLEYLAQPPSFMRQLIEHVFNRRMM